MVEGLLMRTRVDVLSETLADETIVIDLADGRYFRVRGLASALWVVLAEPASFDALLAEAPGTSQGPVASYLLDLIRARLVDADPETCARLGQAADAAAPKFDLVLETYDDMADLLLLDPVHDVGAAGWPARAPSDV